MLNRPVVILSNNPEDFFKMLSIQKELIAIYPFSLSESLINMEMDVLVLDCGTDPLKGIQYLKKFKARRPDVPVIFLTEESSEEIVIKVFKAGARDFFKKPFDFNELKNRIEKLIEYKSKEEKISQHTLDFFVNKNVYIPPHIRRTLDFVYKHCDKKINISDLAKEAGLSRFHFCRVFKKTVGTTPQKFILKVRLERAKALLQMPEKTISEIAFEVGFDNLSNFSKYFKKHTGLTPLQYKKNFLKRSS